jgi:adenosylcobinamide-phosphate synthase
MIESYEAWARSTKLSPKIMGGVAVLGFAIIIWGVVKLLVSIPFIGVLIALYLAYSGLALGCLLKDCHKVAKLLDDGNFENARAELAKLVSRDISELDENEMRKVLAETASENLNDAFVAPFFFLVVTGPAGMWVYKTVSTMDSMWGYKTEEYRDFGFFAAKTDDVLAFIPARITAMIMMGAGRILGLNWRAAWDNVLKDAAKTESPNAGWPMSSAAWLLGATMGGKAVYFGEAKEKPVLGPEGELWSSLKIKRLLRLICFSGLICAVLLYIYFSIVWML